MNRVLQNAIINIVMKYIHRLIHIKGLFLWC